MATNKNQHYVPQCYLRRFSSGSSGASINVLNIDSKRFIENAPIKSQCSKGYFYGEDLRIEKALQPVEGSYSSIIKEISSAGYKFIDEHKYFLKRFWLLQHMRTEAASRRSIEMKEELGEVAGIPAEEFKLELKEAVQDAMDIFIKKIDAVDDLNVCLVRNKTDVGFITSDDPAVLTNKWHLSAKQERVVSFGLGSAGIMILLPLTPEILLIGYDKDVYSITKSSGWVEVKDVKDIMAFNEHQFLNCRANVYTRDSNNKKLLIGSLDGIEQHKPASRHKINYAILDKNENGIKSYVVVNRTEVGEHQEAMMHCQTVFAVPEAWPKQVRWRHKAFVYTNGSGMGYVRKSEVLKLENSGFRKEYVP